jgi:hypothetical protein
MTSLLLFNCAIRGCGINGAPAVTIILSKEHNWVILYSSPKEDVWDES